MAQAYTEFYCRSGGSQLNGGSLSTGAEPSTTAAYTSVNSDWETVGGANKFTPVDGSTPASTVTVGDFASVYLDAATIAVYVARVTAVAAGINGAITLSSSAAFGTKPTAGAVGRSIKVGGAWVGPQGADTFPFNIITGAVTDAVPNPTRLNIKNDQTYNITVGLNYTSSTTLCIQGYTTTAGDGGKFTLDGGTATIVPMTLSGNRSMIADFIIQNNGTTGTNAGLVLSGGRCVAFRGVVNNLRGIGVSLSGAFSTAVEIEAYACNGANTSGAAAFSTGANECIYVRCIAHDNVGSNGNGFTYSAGGLHCFQCIADTNGGAGFLGTSSVPENLIQCDAYNNSGNGITCGSFVVYIDSCNLVKNGGWGIAGANNSSSVGFILNCGFGAGTMANTSGTAQTTLGAVKEIGSVNYASNTAPWVDPANGDFRINLAAAINAGRGTFTETAASYTGTIGYPDIGAAQHLESVGGSGGGMRLAGRGGLASGA